MQSHSGYHSRITYVWFQNKLQSPCSYVSDYGWYEKERGMEEVQLHSIRNASENMLPMLVLLCKNFKWQTVVLKLIRRGLSEKQKKKVQPLLQKAYAANGEGFYVYAPPQTGNVKEQLAYIGRYIRRPAIALRRIEEYDGEYVTFRYFDKKEEQEKTEK